MNAPDVHGSGARLVAGALLLFAAACGGDGDDYRPTAATAPSTDIFLAELVVTEEGALTIRRTVNVTDREGYDNQPHFLPDGSGLLYTSGRDTVQTDIYRHDLSTGGTTRVTRTDDASEYSATVTPDGVTFSAIQERSGAQLLWRYGLDGSDRGVILPDLDPVGYHAWGNATTVFTYVLGDSVSPPTLQVADVPTGESVILAENPGRSLHKIPGRGAVSFVHKLSDAEWIIKAIDVETRAESTLTPTLPGREDYAWLPDGSILMGDGTILYRWQPGGEWSVIADLGANGVVGISRIAVSPDARLIAIVAERPAT
jgi:hypothetical protein